MQNIFPLLVANHISMIKYTIVLDIEIRCIHMLFPFSEETVGHKSEVVLISKVSTERKYISKFEMHFQV